MPPDDVEVRTARPGDWPLLERLVQLYLHDLSSDRGLVPEATGLFPYPVLDTFRTGRVHQPGRRAWLFSTPRAPAGFALTRPWERGGTSMFGFFVVRGLRRTGVGSAAAATLLARVPGEWGIAHQVGNAGAGPFWRSVATAAVGGAWREEVEGPNTWVRFTVEE